MSYSRRIRLLIIMLLVLLSGPGAPIASAGGSSDGDGTRGPAHLRDAPRSGDDDGFSITLTSPLERYLLGIRSIAIDATVPDGDAIERVDFLIDGRLLQSVLEPPYAYETDFGDEIRRHRISVRAVTRDGRRARVLYISRSSDLSNGAAVPLEVVPALVRDARGRPVQGLKVSDFILSENGRRQRIVHFDDEPAPTSIAVVVAAPVDRPAARAGLLQGAARFSESLPAQHALALFDTWQRQPGPSGEPHDPELAFSYQRSRFSQSLTGAGGIEAPRSERPLDAVLMEAVEALRTRPGAHVVVGFLAPEAAPPAAQEETPVIAAVDGDSPSEGPAGADGEAPEEDPLSTALEAMRRTRVGVYAVILGPPGAESGLISAIRSAADDTGGQVVHARSPDRLPAVSAAISRALSYQYLLCYLPENPDRKGWRSIDLKVRRSELEVKARRIYTRTIEANGEPDQGIDSP